MDQGLDYNIIKNEKGPLQRFKNQNLLLKKFGEVGLQVYKVITGKRTVNELRKDLGMDNDVFSGIITYMEEAGMITLESAGESKKQKPSETGKAKGRKPIEEPTEEPVEETKEEKSPEESFEILPEEDLEIKPDDGANEESDIFPPRSRKGQKKKPEEEIFEISEEDTTASDENTEEPQQEEEVAEDADDQEKPVDEIEPFEVENADEEPLTDEASEGKDTSEEGETREEEDLVPSDEGEGLSLDEGSEDLSPVEKIIKEKYGDVGIKVYTLIDGQRTAEEIMNETGLTESKLVEILDFMDEQGIIKLEYPKGKKKTEGGLSSGIEDVHKEEFIPILSSQEGDADMKIIDLSPLEVPIKSRVDIMASMQLKAKLFMNQKASKVYDAVDGQKDSIDLCLKLNIPIYDLASVLKFLISEKVIVVKSLMRAEVKKKYGDDAYNVYKKYGKEGLLLYQLIGREDLSFKQMADKVSKDKEKIVEIFMFIQKVLSLDLPLDKDVLYKQLE